MKLNDKHSQSASLMPDMRHKHGLGHGHTHGHGQGGVQRGKKQLCTEYNTQQPGQPGAVEGGKVENRFEFQTGDSPLDTDIVLEPGVEGEEESFDDPNVSFQQTAPQIALPSPRSLDVRSSYFESHDRTTRRNEQIASHSGDFHPVDDELAASPASSSGLDSHRHTKHPKSKRRELETEPEVQLQVEPDPDLDLELELDPELESESKPKTGLKRLDEGSREVANTRYRSITISELNINPGRSANRSNCSRVPSSAEALAEERATKLRHENAALRAQNTAIEAKLQNLVDKHSGILERLSKIAGPQVPSSGPLHTVTDCENVQETEGRPSRLFSGSKGAIELPAKRVIETLDSQATFVDEGEICNKDIFANGLAQLKNPTSSGVVRAKPEGALQSAQHTATELQSKIHMRECQIATFKRLLGHLLDILPQLMLTAKNLSDRCPSHHSISANSSIAHSQSQNQYQ